MSDNQEIRFARLERAPAYKNVSEAILKDIIDGRLTVGNRLPSEQKLAEQFGVHRSTVRDRLKRQPAVGGRTPHEHGAPWRAKSVQDVRLMFSLD